MLKHFKINTLRDRLIPDFACYQMDLRGPVDASIAAGEVDEEFKLLPSWAKFAAHPIKAKGFFVRTLSALFMGTGGHDELNVDLQTGESKTQRVAMMFLPANTRNDALEIVGNIAQEALPAFEVIVLCGSIKHNGRKITNRLAEKTVKEVVETGRPVLIIAAQMAQRSFSIPEITELYLCYDKGENGATIQKMSRTLTPGSLDKVGRIFSLSFDPNRDDKFDAMIVETAINHKKRGTAKSLREATRDVLRTIDIFKCTPDGSVKIEVDAYLELAMARKGISRVLGKIVDLSKLSASAVTALASGNGDYYRSGKTDVAQSGKTRDPVPPKKGDGTKRDLTAEKEIARAREVIVTILENLDFVIGGTQTTTVADAIAAIADNKDYQAAVEEEFGVAFEVIAYLFETGIIKQDWAELLYNTD